MSGTAFEPIRVPDHVWHTHEAELRARDIGAMFRLAKQYAGASQNRIAAATGVPQSRVNALMNNRGGPVSNISVLERIADGLNLPDTARLDLGLAPRRRERFLRAESAPAGAATSGGSTTDHEAAERTQVRALLAHAAEITMGVPEPGADRGRPDDARTDTPLPSRMGRGDVEPVLGSAARPWEPASPADSADEPGQLGPPPFRPISNRNPPGPIRSAPNDPEFPSGGFPPPPTQDDLERAVAQEARHSARFTHSIARSSIESIALEQISADIRHLARSFISAPLTDLFCDIRDLWREVTAAVACNKYPNQLRDLYLAGSRLSALMAHICLDLGDYSSADTHARATWLSADLAGHAQMQAWSRALQSLVAYWDERYDDAVNTAEDGLRHTRDGTVVVRLHGLQARAHARSGNPAAALAALEAADAARGRIRCPDELAGLFTFPEAKQAAYAGTTFLTLDRPDLVRHGITESERALALYQESAPADQSVGDILAARLDLVTAHVAGESLDGAETELTPVLTTPASQRTASIIRRSLAISNELARPQYSGSSQAKRLREEIASFVAEGGRLMVAESTA